MILHLKNRLMLILMFVPIALPTFIFPGAVARPPFQPPQLTAEQQAELSRLEEELSKMSPEELEAELQKEIDKLPPKEKEAFYQTMEKISQLPDEVLSDFVEGKMSENELEDFLTAVAPDVPLGPDAAKPKDEPAPKQEDVAKKPVKPVPSDKEAKAVDLVKTITVRISSFMVKAFNMPELPGKIKRWDQKHKITWQAGLTFNNFKAALEAFNKKLSQVIELEAGTKNYKHIGNLIKDEALYKHLEKLEKELSRHEPNIEEVSLLDVQKPSAKSRKALQNTISQLVDAMYAAKLPEALDKLFEKYGERAKEIQEAEKKAREKAAAQVKEPRRIAPTVTAGRPPRVDEFAGAPDYGVGDYTGRSTFQPSRPTYRPSPTRPTPTPSVAPRSGAAPTARPGTPSKVTKDAKEEPTAPKTSLPSKDKATAETTARPAVRPKEQDERIIDRQITTLYTAFEDVATLIKDNKKLSDLRAYLISDEPVDVDLAKNVVPPLVEKLTGTGGVIKTIESLKDKLKNASAETKKQYTQEIHDYYNRHKKLFDKVESEIRHIKADWDRLSVKVSASKKDAFLGISSKSATEQTSVQKDSLPLEVEKALTEVFGDDPKQLAAVRKEVMADPAKLEELKKMIPSDILGKKATTIYDLQDAILELRKVMAKL